MNQILQQFQDFLGLGYQGTDRLGSYSSVVWLFLFYQMDLFTWILVAIIGAIILMFILLAFILLPLTQREKKNQAQQKAETVAPEKAVAESAITETTQVSA